MHRMLFLTALLNCVAIAAPPVLNLAEPWGAKRGQAVSITLHGSNLIEGAKIITSLPAVFTPLSPAADKQGKQLPFLVEIKEDTPVGLYPIRIQSSNGLSNILLFSVGTFAEIREAESQAKTMDPLNDSMQTAQELKSTPIIVNGTLHTVDRDFYKIYAKAGEKRVIEVEARRMGSAIDPSMRIYSPKGQLLLRVEDTASLGVDCRTEFTFPQEGNYFIEVRDARFSDQSSNFYRLKIGSYAFGDAIFPLGWTRGKDVEVEISGGNLPSTVRTKPVWEPVPMVSLPNTTATLPIPFVASDRAETLEPAGAGPHPFPVGSVVNGRILKPGEVDRYTLAVEPGRWYSVDVAARELGTSRLDALLTIYDAQGQRIDSAGDKPPRQSDAATIVAGDYSRDPSLIFQAPPKGTQVTIAVEDLSGEGGPAYGYRLLAQEQKPGFEVSLVNPLVNIPSGGTAIVSINVERRGYMGAIQLGVSGIGEGIEVRGGSVPAETGENEGRGASRRGVLTLTAKKGLAASELDLTVYGEAILPDGSKIRRTAKGPGMLTAIKGNFGFVDPSRRNVRPFNASWLGLALPAAVGDEQPAVLKVKSAPHIRIVQGAKYDFPWEFAYSTPGMQAPTNVTTDTPGGRDLRINAGTKPKAGSGMLSMNTTIGTPAATFDVIISARAGSAMNEEIIYAPAITVEVVQGYNVDAPKQSAPLAPNGKAELTGKLSREEGFVQPVTIAADALPTGVNCATVEVAEKDSAYRISCEASADATPGEYKILLNPSSILPEGEKGKVPYKIAAVEATLVVAK